MPIVHVSKEQENLIDFAKDRERFGTAKYEKDKEQDEPLTKQKTKKPRPCHLVPKATLARKTFMKEQPKLQDSVFLEPTSQQKSTTASFKANFQTKKLSVRPQTGVPLSARQNHPSHLQNISVKPDQLGSQTSSTTAGNSGHIYLTETNYLYQKQ